MAVSNNTEQTFRREVYRIESGDPSKGAMAVNTSLDLPLGASVQVSGLLSALTGSSSA